jgi:hypothetical protein
MNDAEEMICCHDEAFGYLVASGVRYRLDAELESCANLGRNIFSAADPGPRVLSNGRATG